MLKFQSIRRENLLNIRFRHDMTGSIVIFSLHSVPIHTHRKITGPRIDCKLKTKRNQTISNSFLSNVIIISVYHMNVVKNFVIQITRRRIRVWFFCLFPRQASSFLKRKHLFAAPEVFSVFYLVCFELRRFENLAWSRFPFHRFLNISFLLLLCYPTKTPNERESRRKEIFENFLCRRKVAR